MNINDSRIKEKIILNRTRNHGQRYTLIRNDLGAGNHGMPPGHYSHEWAVVNGTNPRGYGYQGYMSVDLALSPEWSGVFTPAMRATIRKHTGAGLDVFYEVSAVGFDGGTSDTDERVLWIGAQSMHQVLTALHGVPHADLTAIHDMRPHPTDLDYVLPEQTDELRAALVAFAESKRVQS